MPEPSPTQRVTVWDAATRIFHWSLVILIALAWWTYKTDRMEWHRIAGDATLALLAFRLYWGVVGPGTARFASFVRGPVTAWRYVRGRAAAKLGHNPIGGWSVLALLATVLVQAVSGLYAMDEEGLESGPLADTVSYSTGQMAETWHGMAFNVLLGLIALHVAAILFYALRGDDLVGPMLSGRKRVAEAVAPPRPAMRWAMLPGLLLAAAVFAALWRLDAG